MDFLMYNKKGLNCTAFLPKLDGALVADAIAKGDLL